jgi:hypothetical protein
LTDFLEPITDNVQFDAMLAAVRAAANGDCTQVIPSSIQAVASTFKVVLVPELQVFNVCDAQQGITYSVTLYPSETCTCPVTTTCCHIVATRRSIGATTEKRKPLILSTLRKKAR